MVYRRKKNNKARRILRKIRKGKKLTQKQKTQVKRIVNKNSERKISIEAVSENFLTATTANPFKGFCEIYEVLTPILQQSVDNTLTTGRQYLIQSWREGLRIERANFRSKFRLFLRTDQGAQDSTLGQVNPGIDDLQPMPLPNIGKIWFRFIVYKPRLFSDSSDADTYMRGLFGTGDDPVNYQPWTAIFSYIDQTAVTVVKDSGVKLFETGKLDYSFVYSHFYKSLRYQNAVDLLPDDRRPKLMLAWAWQSAGTVLISLWKETMCMYHDQ